MNDKGNKCVAPHNQNFQIFTNSLPSHSTNVVDHDPSFIVTIDVSTKANNLVNFIEKPKPRCDPSIIFDIRSIIRELNGPLYITAKIKGNLS